MVGWVSVQPTSLYLWPKSWLVGSLSSQLLSTCGPSHGCLGLCPANFSLPVAKVMVGWVSVHPTSLYLWPKSWLLGSLSGQLLPVTRVMVGWVSVRSTSLYLWPKSWLLGCLPVAPSTPSLIFATPGTATRPVTAAGAWVMEIIHKGVSRWSHVLNDASRHLYLSLSSSV